MCSLDVVNHTSRVACAQKGYTQFLNLYKKKRIYTNVLKTTSKIIIQVAHAREVEINIYIVITGLTSIITK